MNNLIDYRISPEKLAKIRSSKQKHKKSSLAKASLVLTFLVTLLISGFFYFSQPNEANAMQFGLGYDYEEILEMNQEFSNNAPASVYSISTSNIKGDKRVVALYLFLEKYNSPMATPTVAKAFIDGADKNGFGDKWYILPAISGIESAFGKVVPKTGKVSSYNGWGWSGGSKYGRWSYFSSWEDAATKVSAGIAKGYASTGFDPIKMMRAYCPPCARPESGGVWARTVKAYIAEMQDIYKSI